MAPSSPTETYVMEVSAPDVSTLVQEETQTVVKSWNRNWLNHQHLDKNTSSLESLSKRITEAEEWVSTMTGRVVTLELRLAQAESR